MLIVVGAHSRKVGKTSIVCGLIRSLPHVDWTALKISANREGASHRHAYRFDQERAPGSHCDTARYLQAGAQRSHWLRASEAQLPAAMPVVQGILDQSRNVVIESNRILEYVDPDAYLLALDYSIADFKQSARRFFAQADAYVLVDRGIEAPPWGDLPLELLDWRPVFPVRRPSFVNPRIAAFADHTLSAAPIARAYLRPPVPRVEPAQRSGVLQDAARVGSLHLE